MSDWLASGLALSAGLGLGAVFFGGLWMTVRHGVVSDCPSLWFMASAVLRTGVVLAGFHAVSGGDWLRLLWSLLGFVIARACITRLTRYTGANPPHTAVEKERAA